MDKLKGYIKPFSVYHTDAYMIAVKNGFEGTEAEWLKSLEMSPEEVDQAVADYLKKNPVAIDETLSVAGEAADAKATGEAISNHRNNKENPHGVTKEQVGLGNADNTSDMDKPVSTAQAQAIADAKKAGTDAQTAANNAQVTADSKLSMELLWVNDKPTSSFAPHTISMDLSAYVGVLVMVKLDANTDTLTSEYGQKGKTHRVSASRLNTIDSKTYLGFARKFTVSDNGVDFDYGTANTATSTTNLSTSMIPVYIYGIKGVSA